MYAMYIVYDTIEKTIQWRMYSKIERKKMVECMIQLGKKIKAKFQRISNYQ